jgi:hypothetical protein
MIYEYVNREMLNSDFKFLFWQKRVPCCCDNLDLYVYWKNEEQRESLEPELYFVEAKNVKKVDPIPC